jgi:hypothetical protein
VRGRKPESDVAIVRERQSDREILKWVVGAGGWATVILEVRF